MSNLYLISYDLNKDKHYPELWKALADFGAKKILFSEWLVRRDGATAKGIADHMLNFMDADDSIYVCRIEDGASCQAWRRTMVDPGTI